MHFLKSKSVSLFIRLDQQQKINIRLDQHNFLIKINRQKIINHNKFEICMI